MLQAKPLANEYAGTAVQYRLPVAIILNNERLGMVSMAELLHGERYSHSWSEALQIL